MFNQEVLNFKAMVDKLVDERDNLQELVNRMGG